MEDRKRNTVLNCILPPELYKQLCDYAEQESLTKTTIVISALKNYLKEDSGSLDFSELYDKIEEIYNLEECILQNILLKKTQEDRKQG